MNFSKYIYILLIFFFNNKINCLFFKNNEKIIISLTSSHELIYNTEKVINSIIKQNISQNLYEIILLLSYNQFRNISDLPKTIQFFEKTKKIKILFMKDTLTEQKRTLITMKNYNNNPVLIVNNICLLPNGWLEMFIRDHIKYPNDAIAASFQYYFDKNIEISEFREGFNGNKFGLFNHVSEIIFNFGLINIDLGGILYPKHFFKNELFYEHNLFLMSTYNSEDFWESAFIIIEDKIVRQSSKIFDYTKYLIEEFNYQEYNSNRKKILEKSQLSFLKQFPKFKDDIKKRQKKIIVSLASYPQRFTYLPDLMNFIKNQSFPINKINFFFFKEHKKYYNLNIKDANIIYTDKNLKSHLKYYYAMQLFRDYAIITLDDDLGYSYDTFESLFNAYVENPNIISGRRAHLMTYKNNGELKRYIDWIFEYKFINESDFNLTLTNGAGSIFPPDILNINEEFLQIIGETITCDDLTLKHFSVMKGIPHKWIINDNIMGIPRNLPKTKSIPLFNININFNDICINKLNININNLVLKNLCVSYRNLSTGTSIYLYDMHNKRLTNDRIYFDLYAYSFCSIDNNLNFTIYFNNITGQCFIKQSKKIFLENNKKLVSCIMDKFNLDLDNFSPKVIPSDNIKINIFNYRKYLTAIFKDFICENFNNCLLEVLLYENLSSNNFSLKINNEFYSCNLFDKNNVSYNIFPVKTKFKCFLIDSQKNIKLTGKNIISGLPPVIKVLNKPLDNDIILCEFIVLRYFLDDKNKNLIIIGRLQDDLNDDFYNIIVNLIYPHISLKCSLRGYSKHVQSIISCEINNICVNDKEIIIENQIIQLVNGKLGLLLINEETLIKINFNNIKIRKNTKRNKKIIKLIKESKNNFYFLIYISLIIIIIIKIKIIKN